MEVTVLAWALLVAGGYFAGLSEGLKKDRTPAVERHVYTALGCLGVGIVLLAVQI